MKRVIPLLLLVCIPMLGACQGSGSRYEDPAELATLIANATAPDALLYYLVDVRTPDEYSRGHLPTAVNVPNTEIGARPPTTDKAALIIVYCASGGRSTASKKVLDDLGYTRVVNFGAVGRWTGVLVTGDKPGPG